MVCDDLEKPITLQQGFRFTVPGRLCRNNVYTKPWRGRSVRNDQASRDLALINELASVAADQAIWRTLGEGDAAGLTFILWNQLGDIDARPKVLLDGLQKVVYDDDKRVQRLLLEVEYDTGEPRVDVIVEQRIPRVRPPKPAKARTMRFGDLRPLDLEIILTTAEAVLDPNPGVVQPLPFSEIPEAWITRARKALKKDAPCLPT